MKVVLKRHPDGEGGYQVYRDKELVGLVFYPPFIRSWFAHPNPDATSIAGAIPGTFDKREDAVEALLEKVAA